VYLAGAGLRVAGLFTRKVSRLLRQAGAVLDDDRLVSAAILTLAQPTSAVIDRSPLRASIAQGAAA
jgi:siroheme synthase